MLVNKMKICLICNGLGELQEECPNCRKALADGGKLYDYFDDYSPYMEIDLEKLEDGDPASTKKETCVHLYYCVHCGYEEKKEIAYRKV
ncbi:hypothetical protein BpJC7_12910 [Weizmannia acidilactici]|uniref:Uncharacterized protein n=1 Tax=Weizmannia acidilactici TaxID=2607726 RepID=A0A5J4JHU1_9BACI|nr:hypothetical protein [Weizmannia acidilactici]GER69988.1 hypothetical protein BpJC7_12910 [Weizmannia acidilactici]GER73079.1 hypothetical protein BpPP18_11460 [Weizmannia acidilactici]